MVSTNMSPSSVVRYQPAKWYPSRSGVGYPHKSILLQIFIRQRRIFRAYGIPTADCDSEYAFRNRYFFHIFLLIFVFHFSLVFLLCKLLFDGSFYHFCGAKHSWQMSHYCNMWLFHNYSNDSYYYICHFIPFSFFRKRDILYTETRKCFH